MLTFQRILALKSVCTNLGSNSWPSVFSSLSMLLMVTLVFGMVQKPAAAVEKPTTKTSAPAPTKTPAKPGKATAPSADASAEIPPPPDPLELFKQEIQGKLDEQAKLNAKLREDMDGLGQNLRANSKSIEELKAKLEENAILVYEHLSRGTARTESFEQMKGRLDSIEGRLGLRSKRSTDQKPAPAQGSSTPPASSDRAESGGSGVDSPGTTPAAPLPVVGESVSALTSAALLLVVLLGLSLVEMSRLHAWALPQAAVRNILITAAAALSFFTAGYWIMSGKPVLGEATASIVDTTDAVRLYQMARVLVATLVVAMIVSDRLSLPVYAFLAVVFSALIYPLIGRWTGTGWLQGLGFQDFAGATTVHSLAAWFAAGWLWRFPMTRALEANPPGVTAPPNHTLALLGAFLLWLGWLGFPIGAPEGESHSAAFSALNMVLGGAAALCASMIYLLTSRRASGIDSLLTRLSAGLIAGLVSVSAGLNRFEPAEAIAVGAIAGLVLPHAYEALTTKLFRQDQVAALLIAVHGACGALGTLCVALLGSPGAFSRPDPAAFGAQTVGILLVLISGLLAGVLGAFISDAAPRLNAVRHSASKT